MGLKDRVKQRRELLGLSQKNIGDAVGVRQQTIQQIEDGKIKRSRHIEKIARVLKVTPEWLLFGTGHPEDKTLQSNEIKLGRSFVGIELVQEYVDLARSRISAEIGLF